MASRPGKLLSVFNSGELDPLLHQRTETKYYNSGLARAENIEVTPQGGFRLRDGLRDVGPLQSDAQRLFAFTSSKGISYDIAFRPGECDVWGQADKVATVTVAKVSTDLLPEMTAAQQLDTMLLFHQDLQPQRLTQQSPFVWNVDDAPFIGVPNWDFGADINGDPYVNGVSAKWELEFIGLTDASTTFTLTVSNQETTQVTYSSTMATLISRVKSAVEALPNVATGITVTNPSGTKIDIAFDGTGNEGDEWAVSARVVNKSDAAITAARVVVGIAPGEPVWSDDRGYPQCGTFYQQKLILGGFNALPNAWAFSTTGSYYDFDERNSEANGPALVPMDTPGGESIEAIVDNRYLLIHTNRANYWIADRALSRATPPNHVQAAINGIKRGLPPVINEGAVLYAPPSGNVLSELRYTDVEGNYVSVDVSLIAAHLIEGIADIAQQTATKSTDGNHIAVVKEDGSALLGTFLRDQDPPVTAFTRVTSPGGEFVATARNGRNELSFIVGRQAGRRLERFEDGLLLDEAIDIVNDPAAAAISGLERFNGGTVWAIGDRDVFGPFDVSGGTITLPRACALVTVGTWLPPVADTLPLDRGIGPQIVNRGKARIYAVTLSLIDTTSVAIGINGRRLQDVDLYRWGMPADVAELDAGFTGEIKVAGLMGYSDAPYVRVSQLRPGRLTVRSLTLHAKV